MEILKFLPLYYGMLLEHLVIEILIRALVEPYLIYCSLYQSLYEA